MMNMGTCSAEDIDKMTHLNAMRVFQFDPFTHRTPDSCTVGALRNEAAEHSADLTAPALAHAGASRGESGDWRDAWTRSGRNF